MASACRWCGWTGTLYDKYHGETEKNLRTALASTEQTAPCVLWIDEIEGLAAGSGDGDGGLSRRVLGYPADRMAERKSRVFLVATANQVQDLPAEPAAQGRFDEIFRRPARCRDPCRDLRLAPDRRKPPRDGIDLQALAEASTGFPAPRSSRPSSARCTPCMARNPYRIPPRCCRRCATPGRCRCHGRTGCVRRVLALLRTVPAD